MQRIAFASEGAGLEGTLSAHFGRCPFYTFVNVEGDRIMGFDVVENPYFPNHQPGVIPEFIHAQKAREPSTFSASWGSLWPREFRGKLGT